LTNNFLYDIIIIESEREVLTMTHDRRKDMSKKAWKELQKQNRATNGFNTGTRTMKSDKYPSRARRKEMEREEEE
jgi:lipopolysaccharide biosynthesis glycosyltransferase